MPMNVAPRNRAGRSQGIEGDAAMLDSVFTISTLIFFVLSGLYVKFCDGLR
jgi:hypothetical protein